MIWYQLARLVRFLVRLIMPLKPLDVAKIDRDAKCPMCGHTLGVLRAVEADVREQGGSPRKKPLCQHTCQICGYRWFENPVVKLEPASGRPAVARDEHERAEDAAAVLAARGGR